MGQNQVRDLVPLTPGFRTHDTEDAEDPPYCKGKQVEEPQAEGDFGLEEIEEAQNVEAELELQLRYPVEDGQDEVLDRFLRIINEQLRATPDKITLG